MDGSKDNSDRKTNKRKKEESFVLALQVQGGSAKGVLDPRPCKERRRRMEKTKRRNIKITFMLCLLAQKGKQKEFLKWTLMIETKSLFD